eukprot:m.30826 g.30826  ORF g.30826 m.30826 type:complete len:631 (+) comp4749_c0_seq1:625-2517(+)
MADQRTRPADDSALAFAPSPRRARTDDVDPTDIVAGRSALGNCSPPVQPPTLPYPDAETLVFRVPRQDWTFSYSNRATLHVKLTDVLAKHGVCTETVLFMEVHLCVDRRARSFNFKLGIDFEGAYPLVTACADVETDHHKWFIGELYEADQERYPFKVTALTFSATPEAGKFETHVQDIAVVIKEAPPQPLTLPGFSAVLPVGSTFTLDEHTYTYRGYDMEFEHVIAEHDGSTDKIPLANVGRTHFTPPQGDIFEGAPGVEVSALPPLKDGTDYSRKLNNATFNILARLATATIRGVPVLSLLRFIHRERGIPVPVMVVGGAVRDALLGDKINDIDLAIARPYDLLKEDIHKFFAMKGHPLIEGNTLLCDDDRKHFGMLKIVKTDEDPDHFDVGVFKSTYLKDKPVCGYSPLGDAMQRDYTINAVYLDVFKARLYDPFGALVHLNVGAGTPIRFFPCAKYLPPDQREEILKDDFGGCVRVFKMMRKKWHNGAYMYCVEEKVTFESLRPVFQCLNHTIETCTQDLKKIVSGYDQQHNRDRQKNLRCVLRKVANKLFKPSDNFGAVAEELRASVERLEDDGECLRLGQEFWSKLRDLARRVMNGDGGVFNHYTVDDPDQHRVLRVMTALAEL